MPNRLDKGTLPQPASLGLVTRGDVDADEPNGCTYAKGRRDKITSSWDEKQPWGKGNAPSR